MHILPFLKYFKPYWRRLLIAAFCMIIVGGLSTAPYLVGREAANVLIIAGLGDTRDDAKVPDFLQGVIGSGVLKKVQTVKADAQSTGATERPHKLNKAAMILGRFYTTPKAWVDGVRAWWSIKTEPARTWYQHAVMKRPCTALGVLAVVLVLAMIVKGLADFSSGYQLAHTFFRTNLQMREDLFANIIRQDYLYFNENAPGYLHSRINSDVNSLRVILETILYKGVQQPVTLFFMMAFLLYLNAKLTLSVFVIIPIIGLVLYQFAQILRKNTRQQKAKQDLLSSGLTESLNNIRLVKAFATEDLEIQKFRDRALALFRYMMARRVVKFGSSPIMEFLGSLAASGVLLAGGYMIVNRTLSFVDFLIYLFTLRSFYAPLRSLATINANYQEANVSCERMTQMLAMKPRLIENENAGPFRKVQDAIELRGVGFRYDDKQILRDINVRVQAGHRVAFAGPSGGGKTTLVNMLARLFDPTEGQILVDGVDLRDLNITDWRRHLAIVTQDTFLFDDTVENNITYGSDVVDPERVQAAAQVANAHEFIMELDGGLGYKTMLGTSGGKLSGGQRQRIAIARAVYRNPDILILDEATSALDAQSQAIVQEALNRLMVGRTSFVVAHRISTIRGVDCIYVLDDGHVVEHGSHQELMKANGLYRAMVTEIGLVSDDAMVDEKSLSSLTGAQV